MKKRVFVPHSIGFILLNCFFWGLSILYLTISILPLCGVEIPSLHLQPHEHVIFVLAIIFLLYTSIRFLLCFKIHLRKEDIYTFGDMLPKFEKIQYKCKIKYIDIQNISIIASEKNSKNKKIQLKWVSSSMPKKYLEFTLVNNKKERMCINHYTKNQVRKLLTFISFNMVESKCKNSLDVNEIMKSWYAYNPPKKEKHKKDTQK